MAGIAHVFGMCMRQLPQASFAFTVLSMLDGHLKPGTGHLDQQSQLFAHGAPADHACRLKPTTTSKLARELALNSTVIPRWGRCPRSMGRCPQRRLGMIRRTRLRPQRHECRCQGE